MSGTPGRPHVSVVIVVRNGEHVLQRQLDALDGQVDAPPFEVLVVDNGSTDATREVVRRWVATGARTPVRSSLVDAGARPSIPRARNTGAEASRGDLIAYCDADDVVSPGWVAALAAGLTAPGLAGGAREAFDADGAPRPDASARALSATPYLPFAATCNLAVTRDCFFDVGGFDESLPPYGFEDVDFCWRAQLAGYPLVFVPEAVIRFTVSSKVRAVRKEFLLAKARMAIVHRHPAFDPTPYSLTYCLADVASSVARLPGRLRRPRVSRTREVRWVVDAVGRLVGYWHYSVRGRDATSVLLTGDPLAPGA